MIGLAGKRAQLFVWKRERDKLARLDRLPFGEGSKDALGRDPDARVAVSRGHERAPADHAVAVIGAEESNARAIARRGFDGLFHTPHHTMICQGSTT